MIEKQSKVVHTLTVRNNDYGQRRKMYRNLLMSSPTIAFEALLYTLMIDALQFRVMATLDLPGHFLQTDMDELVILKIQDALAKLLVEMNTTLWKNIYDTNVVDL